MPSRRCASCTPRSHASTRIRRRRAMCLLQRGHDPPCRATHGARRCATRSSAWRRVARAAAAALVEAALLGAIGYAYHLQTPRRRSRALLRTIAAQVPGTGPRGQRRCARRPQRLGSIDARRGRAAARAGAAGRERAHRAATRTRHRADCHGRRQSRARVAGARATPAGARSVRTRMSGWRSVTATSSARCIA